MNKQKMTIWGREFELEIVFDCYKGEEILPSQKDTLNGFLAHPDLIDGAKAAVEKYCIDRDSKSIGDDKIDNIFKYVIPESLYIQRTRDERRVVGLMCRYKFDVDHGIAVVFENESLKEIGNQDIIL